MADPTIRHLYQFSLASVFWVTTALAFFFAAWIYLPMARVWSRFWYSWSATMLGIGVIRLAIGVWSLIRSDHSATQP